MLSGTFSTHCYEPRSRKRKHSSVSRNLFLLRWRCSRVPVGADPLRVLSSVLLEYVCIKLVASRARTCGPHRFHRTLLQHSSDISTIGSLVDPLIVSVPNTRSMPLPPASAGYSSNATKHLTSIIARYASSLRPTHALRGSFGSSVMDPDVSVKMTSTISFFWESMSL